MSVEQLENLHYLMEENQLTPTWQCPLEKILQLIEYRLLFLRISNYRFRLMLPYSWPLNYFWSHFELIPWLKLAVDCKPKGL